MLFKCALLLAVLLAASLSPLAAQEAATCDTALDTLTGAALACAQTARGTVCLALPPLTTAAGVLAGAGETADLAPLAALTVGAGGAALLRLQANLPNSAADQYVTAWALGGLMIENLALPQPGSASLLKPFQSIRLQAIDEAGCVPAGLLMQSPDGSDAALLVNGVLMQMSGTIFVQPTAVALSAAVIEGSVTLQAADAQQLVEIGQAVTIPLGDDGLAVGEIGEVASFDPAAFVTLPLSVLPRAAAVVVNTCLLTVKTNANRRAGPGTEFAIAGVLAEGAEVVAVGQTQTSDARLWYRLMDQSWVRADLVTADAACAGLASAETEPAPAPAASAPAATPDAAYFVNNCAVTSGTLAPGKLVRFFFGGGGYPTRRAAQDTLKGLEGAITINGVPLNAVLGVIEWGENNYGVQVLGDWRAEAGTFTLAANLALFGGQSKTCQVMISAG